MVEIAVPRRVFDIPGHGFLLLPGVEQGDSFHVRLAQRVLPTATTALMCVDSGLLARKTVDDEVRRIRNEMQIGDTKILYAVTKPQSKEKAASTVATIQDRFDVLDEQRIATIFPPNDRGDISWRNQIREAIRDYGQIPQTRRDAKNKALRTTLYDLEDHLAVIEEKLDRKKVKIRSDRRSSIGALLEEFDKAAEVQRKELEKDLDKKLSTYCEEAKDAVARRIRSEGTGNKIKRFFQAPLSERIDFQDMVRCEWEQIDDHGPAGVIMNTLNSVSQQFLPRKDGLPQIGRSASEDLPELSKVERKDKMIGSLVLADREGEEVSPDMVHDVRYLMVAPKNSKQNNIEKRSDHFPLNVRMVPALALETMRVAFVANSLDGVTIGQEGAETALDEALSPDSLTEEVLNTREQGKGILKGIGAMVGLDVLPDGELDLVKEIVVAAGGTVKMAYLGPAVGALAATYAGFALIKSVRQHDINRDGAAQIAFERITSRTKENVLSVYDDYMAHVRRHMEQVVRKKLKVDREFADYYNVRAALIGVETSIRETKQRIPVGL